MLQNEWVISRIFKKSSEGKKENIPGQIRNRNYVANSQQSDLPPLMDLSSDKFTDSHLVSSSSSKKSDIPLATLKSPKVSTPSSVFFAMPFIQNIQDWSSFEVGLGSYEDQELPIISAGNMDLDCLWNC